MAVLTFEGQRFALAAGESVLDCLLRNGQPIQHSCKAGLCQSCLVQAVDAEVPPKAQAGLKGTLQASKHAMACQWCADADITVKLPGAAAAAVDSLVCELTLLNAAVMKLVLKPADAASLDCKPGQYMNLTNPAGIVRSYSVANDVQRDGTLEFHVARTKQGMFTRWLFESAAVGDAIPLRGPAGSCFYLPDAGQNEPLLLSAVGTGLAPLFGILNDALAQGHRGPVTLVHGSGQPELLYYRAELQQLAQQHVNFCYVPVVLENPTSDVSCRSGDAASLTMAALDPARIAETRVFLCGNPDFVRGLRKQAFMKGVRSANIFCDAFVQRPVAAV